VISSEKDVRSAVRRDLPGGYWVEPSMGSTDGIPDTFWIEDGRVTWAELKVAKARKGYWWVEFTPPQLRTIPRMIEEGAKVMLIVGLLGTEEIFGMDILPVIMAHGRLDPRDLGVPPIEWKNGKITF
jgi:hypothetical protein